MAKLDFSSLKTADLRSVAPVDETAIPRAQGAQTGGGSSDSSSGFSAAASSSSPASVSVQTAPAAPESSLPVSAPVVPAATAVASAPAPVSRWAVASKGRISLTNLKTGGTSAVSQTAPDSAVSSPAAVTAPVEVAAHESPVSVPAHSVPAHHAPKAKISLGTKPAVSISIPKKSDQEAVAAVPSVATAVEPEVSDTASVSQSAEANSENHSERAPVVGVDIIEAAKVVGTEGESIANEILTEALTDPEEAKKAAEEKAVAAVVIPDAGKEFFPNLEMDDGFFEDPLFEGIVPPKPEKKAVVAEESKTEEASVAAETVEAVAEGSANAESAVETAVEAIPTEEAVAGESATSSVVAEESKTEEASVAAETAEAVAEGSANAESAAETAVEAIPTEEAVTASSEPTSPESYVETVAKDLTAERKGGLAKLFGERKVLVRAVAGLFAVAVVGTGAFTFMGPEIKTSGPEFANTGTELPPPVEKYVPDGEVKIVGEGVRVISVRRPNVHKQKKAVVETSTGAVAESASGVVSDPESASGTGVAPDLPDAPSAVPSVPQAPSEPVAWPAVSPEPPEAPVAPQGTGAVEMPALPDSQLPEPPAANPSENVP